MRLSEALRILALVVTATALLFTLGACTRTEYVDRPVKTYVKVTEPCVDGIPEPPVYETERLKPDDSIGLVGQAYRIERQQRESYAEELRAELEGCLKPEQSDP